MVNNDELNAPSVTRVFGISGTPKDNLVTAIRALNMFETVPEQNLLVEIDTYIQKQLNSCTGVPQDIEPVDLHFHGSIGSGVSNQAHARYKALSQDDQNQILFLRDNDQGIIKHIPMLEAIIDQAVGFEEKQSLLKKLAPIDDIVVEMLRKDAITERKNTIRDINLPHDEAIAVMSKAENDHRYNNDIFIFRSFSDCKLLCLSPDNVDVGALVAPQVITEYIDAMVLLPQLLLFAERHPGRFQLWYNPGENAETKTIAEVAFHVEDNIVHSEKNDEALKCILRDVHNNFTQIGDYAQFIDYAEKCGVKLDAEDLNDIVVTCAAALDIMIASPTYSGPQDIENTDDLDKKERKNLQDLKDAATLDCSSLRKKIKDFVSTEPTEPCEFDPPREEEPA